MKVKNLKLKVKNNNLKLKFIIFLLTFVTFHFLLFTFHLRLRQARAQSLSLSISPPVVEVLIKPGKTVIQSIKISNRGESATVTPQLFVYDAYGIRAGSSQEAQLPWLSFIDGNTAIGNPFLLPAGETREIKLRISPPKDLADQEFYRVLLFSTSVAPGGEQSQTQLSEGVGTVLLLTVSASGELKKSARIVRFDVPLIHDSLTPLAASIFVHNSGTTFFHPNGTITVEGPSGKAEFTLTPSVLLAGQTKQLSLSEQEDRKTTLYLPGLFLGRYRLTTTFRLDEGSITVNEQKTLYALPWKGLLIIIGIGILVFLKGRIGKKRA